MRIWEQTIYWLNQNSGYLLEKRNETIKEEFQENILEAKDPEKILDKIDQNNVIPYLLEKRNETILDYLTAQIKKQDFYTIIYKPVFIELMTILSYSNYEVVKYNSNFNEVAKAKILEKYKGNDCSAESIAKLLEIIHFFLEKNIYPHITAEQKLAKIKNRIKNKLRIQVRENWFKVFIHVGNSNSFEDYISQNDETNELIYNYDLPIYITSNATTNLYDETRLINGQLIIKLKDIGGDLKNEESFRTINKMIDLAVRDKIDAIIEHKEKIENIKIYLFCHSLDDGPDLSSNYFGAAGSEFSFYNASKLLSNIIQASFKKIKLVNNIDIFLRASLTGNIPTGINYADNKMPRTVLVNYEEAIKNTDQTKKGSIAITLANLIIENLNNKNIGDIKKINFKSPTGLCTFYVNRNRSPMTITNHESYFTHSKKIQVKSLIKLHIPE